MPKIGRIIQVQIGGKSKDSLSVSSELLEFASLTSMTVPGVLVADLGNRLRIRLLHPIGEKNVVEISKSCLK